MRVWHALSSYSINPWRPAVNTYECIGGLLTQSLLWLIGGVLVGLGFVSAFGGGLLFLLLGVAILAITARRYRRRWRGWSASLYGAGASIALLLSPYVFRESRCVQKTDAGCFQVFNIAVFGLAVCLALAGLILGVIEIRRWHQSSTSQRRLR